MLCIRLINTLLLATACLPLTSVGSLERAVTCGENGNVHRLSCDIGVISVQRALYGRTNRRICSEGRPRRQLSNTWCSLRGTTERIKRRCNSKTTCEINIREIRTSDPCRGIHKYVDTLYTCLPAIRLIACENSVARLHCDVGQVIFVYGSYYGREDSNICAYRRFPFQVRNQFCSNPTKKVAERCNGANSCTIAASTAMFGDPCVGTYKYLEVAYICEYPVH